MTDIFDQRWCCLTCSTTFRLGRMKLGRTMADALCCPNCDSEDTHQAYGTVQAVSEYIGEIGTKN